MNLQLLRYLSAVGGMLMAAVMLATAALADSASLKGSGAADELGDGYLSVVTGTRALGAAEAVAEINAARRAAYMDVAAKTGASLADVEAIAGARLRLATMNEEFDGGTAESGNGVKAEINRALDEVIAGNPGIFD
ncbi:MAG: DUF1318 domain-containing protein [Alphaproteobacteria bacterium]|jgi:hypothetical protein|nr:DUF1318 domain-containing protein [Alphaproteobacteria bacterium]